MLEEKDTAINYTILGHTITVHLYYDPQYEIDTTLDHLEAALTANVSFYTTFGTLPKDIDVHLLYTRQQYDEVIGHASQPWAGGHSHGSEAYLFHPDRIEVETTHLRGSFSKTLIHEISHIFTRALFKKYLWWVTEGVAQYIARQDEIKSLEEASISHFLTNSLTANIKYGDFANAQGHQMSKQLTYAIARRYGVSALYELLSINPDEEDANGKLAKILRTDTIHLQNTVRKLLGTEHRPSK
jgi:hypothetical protein